MAQIKYKLIDTKENFYSVKKGSPFTNFDAGETFISILNKYFPSIEYDIEILSERKGKNNMREILYKMSWKISPLSYFYVYCFQTEGGGRKNLPHEARIQWRSFSLWNPPLNKDKVAQTFNVQSNIDLKDRECYLLSFHKRNKDDEDIIISGIYPSLSEDVEVNSSSNKSIQYDYNDIRTAYIKGISYSKKLKDKPPVIHFKPQYLIWYMIHRDELHTKSLQEIEETIDAELNPATKAPIVSIIGIDVPHNQIIYGAPGTGKSYELREQAHKYFNDDNIIRLTFHPNYTYQQFIGTYKPTPIYKTIDGSSKLYKSDKITELKDHHHKEPLIDYSFVEGPFLTQLVNAINNPDKPYLLIIEEINRAPVASVFGDVFQLLDRDKNGNSEYEIEFNTDICNYLKSKGIESKKIGLPANFYIWATMNSADQGVMPLDAAFKRRWSFKYLPLEEKAEVTKEYKIIFQEKNYSWNDFRNKLNDRLKTLSIPEDRLIGPFFVKEAELQNVDIIKNKLLLYLRDDVVRHNPESLFKQKTFSDIINAYDNGEEIFKENFLGELNELTAIEEVEEENATIVQPIEADEVKSEEVDITSDHSEEIQ